jgi:hypothetical protein
LARLRRLVTPVSVRERSLVLLCYKEETTRLIDLLAKYV